MKKHNNGFSLVEMAVVLVIIGLLLGGLIMPFTVQMEQQRIERTNETLEEIKEALLGFAIIHQRLPCSAPDEDKDKDGEDILEKDKGKEHQDWCKIEGFLPWKDLGVRRYDGWGNQFRYRVENEYSKKPMIFSEVVVDNSGTGSGLRIRKKIKYQADADDQFEWLAKKSDDSRVAAIIFSCGKNGRPDPTKDPAIPDNIDYMYTNDADGIRNKYAICNNPRSGLQNRNYVRNLPIEGTFDDIITWLSRNTLVNRLIITEQWPPEQWTP
jgi:prepilin-type N-terminal cleavage/methylation domain-containing protein